MLRAGAAAAIYCSEQAVFPAATSLRLADLFAANTVRIEYPAAPLSCRHLSRQTICTACYRSEAGQRTHELPRSVERYIHAPQDGGAFLVSISSCRLIEFTGADAGDNLAVAQRFYDTLQPFCTGSALSMQQISSQ